MARLTKEEKKVFDPTLLIQNQKWKSDTIKGLMIGEGKEEGGHSPYQPWKPAPGGPYVPAPSRDKMKISSTPQGGGYPTTPSYINYKEIRDVNPYLIDQFIKDRGLEIFKLQTGIPLAQNLEGDGGGWEHWDAETKQRFLMETDEEYKQWLKEKNLIDEGDQQKQSLKIGNRQLAMNPADIPLGDGMINNAKTNMQNSNKQKYDLMYQEGFINRKQYEKQMKRTFGKDYEQYLVD